MAEQRLKSGAWQIHVSYSFDRLLESKLAPADNILVPTRECPVAGKESANDDGSHLRAGLVRATARGEHDCEPDGVADRIRKEARSGGTAEWVFEDDGYSGATLERPGWERVRDLAAEGQIQVVLAYSPDPLSWKYAYQILLIEELARHGVETLFVKAPQGDSAEDQLLVQFQGMIAEYERAQILERSRRGKRHRAHSGEISVLSGAPYGYRYIRKTDEVPARLQRVRPGGLCSAAHLRDVYGARLQYWRDYAPTQCGRHSHSQSQCALGTLDGLGCPTQPCLSWRRLLWQDAGF